MLDEHLQAIARDGYTILENVVDPGWMDEIIDAIASIGRSEKIVPATNEFEGVETLRLYNLLAYGNPFAQILAFEPLLEVLGGVLDRGCLVSTLSSIDIGPGETSQMIHADDQVIGLERPHHAIVCNPIRHGTTQDMRHGIRLVCGIEFQPGALGVLSLIHI